MTDNTIDTQGASTTPDKAKQPSVSKSITPTRLCGHPELHLTQAGETKPAPAFMVGCIHNHFCPVCGFGQGLHPHDPNCPDKLGKVTDLQPSNAPSQGKGHSEAQS